MLRRILAVAATAALVWGCSSTPDESASDSSTGDSGGATVSAPATSAPITSSPAPSQSGIQSGSAEDFLVNVGDRVLFGFDRFDLTAQAREVLQRQAEWLNQYGNISVIVAGHTDERGTREYNLALGERRAIAVRNYLVALGVEPSRIRTISYGKERPVDARSTDEAWAKNRRGVTQLEESSVSRLTN